MFKNLISAFDWTTGLFIGLLVVMVIILVVLPMFTNKKRNKAVNELHSSLRPGDVIKTVGGVIGTITAIRDVSPVDKEMVIETGEGDNKSSLVFDVQAVYQVISKINAPVVETAPEAKVEPFATQDNTAAIDVTTNVSETVEPKSEDVAPAQDAIAEVKTVSTAKKTAKK